MAEIARKVVKVMNLGKMGYIPALDLQTRYANTHLEEINGKPGVVADDLLLLVEHSPVYTIGIRREQYTAVDEQYLKRLGAEFIRTNRGGLITFHGPGQLVAYPVLNLKHFHPSVRWYVQTLESTMIGVCKRFGINAGTTKDTGIWVGDRKIGAIGINVNRYITTHGIALNSNVDLSWYDHIVACGIVGKGVTSISKEINEDTTVLDTIPKFLESFEEEFDCDVEMSLLEDHEKTSFQRKESAKN